MNDRASLVAFVTGARPKGFYALTTCYRTQRRLPVHQWPLKVLRAVAVALVANDQENWPADCHDPHARVKRIRGV